MNLFFDLLEILGHWLVFSFSLYEGLLNLSEHASFAQKYRSSLGALHFNFIERLIFPLYFYKLKESAMKLVKMHNASMSEASELLKLIDRAILWIYLSIGGWLVWLCALFNLVKNHTDNGSMLFYLSMALLGTLLSILNVKIRIKKRHERLCRLSSDCLDTDEFDIKLP